MSNSLTAELNRKGLLEMQLGRVDPMGLRDRLIVAQQLFLEALNISREEPVSLFNLGLVQYYLENPEAKASFEEARTVSEQKGSKETLVNSTYMLAVTQKQAGEYENAFANALQALDLANGEDYDCLILLSGIGLSTTEFVTAEEFARRACRANDDEGDGHYNLACALEGQGRIEEAVKSLERAFQCKSSLRELAFGDIERGKEPDRDVSKSAVIIRQKELS